MRNELTERDIQMMKEELDHRRIELRPKLLEAVKEARGFGDLSENYEYKAAKDEQRRNRSRIRYLKQMVASAVVIEDHSQSGEIGLFDRVKLHMEDEDEDMDIRLVTTLRQNPLKGLISKESPLGQALLGHRAGERVYVKISGEEGYWCSILSVEKGEDDENLEISRY